MGAKEYFTGLSFAARWRAERFEDDSDDVDGSGIVSLLELDEVVS